MITEERITLVARLLAIFVVLYLFELTNFTLSIDDEFAAFRQDHIVWAQQGRWVAYLLERFVVTQPTLPYLPILVFGIGISLGYSLLSSGHGLTDKKYFLFILFPVFAIFPTWFYLVSFRPNIFHCGLGVCLTCYAISSFAFEIRQHDKSKILSYETLRLLPASLALALAVGLYQSFYLFFVAACLGIFLIDLIDRKRLPETASVAAFGFICLFGFVFYALAQKIVLRTSGGEFDPYIASYINFRQLFSDPRSVVGLVANEFWKIYTGADLIYWHAIPLIPLLLMASFASMIIELRRCELRLKLASVGLFGAVLIVPSFLNFLAGGFVPYRSLVAVPYVIWLCGVILVKTVAVSIRPYVGLMIFALVFEFSHSQALFNAAKSSVDSYDRQLAASIYQRILAEQKQFSAGETIDVDFYGAVPYRSIMKPASQTLVDSFFEWNGGSPARMVNFMRLNGYDSLRLVSPQNRAKLIYEFQKMPVWPTAGSVKVVDGVTLVRLGIVPGVEHVNVQGELGRDQSRALLTLDGKQIYDSLNVKNVAHVLEDGQVEFDRGAGPIIYVKLDAAAAKACSVLQVQLTHSLEEATAMIVYYAPKNSKEKVADRSQAVWQVAGDRRQSVFLQATEGFEPTIRIQPVLNSQKHTIKEIFVGCLIPR